MTTVSFCPTNELEEILVQLISGRLAFTEFLKSLMDADVHALSATDLHPDGTGFQPLLFDRDIGTLLAVFTSRDRGTMFSDRLPYCLTLNGRQFFGWIPAGFGIVLNPGSTVGFEIPPEGVQNIRRDFVDMENG